MIEQANKSIPLFSSAWFADHYGITFVLIYIFIIYIYNKVFRVRKLPLLKNLIVYLAAAVGAFILLMFQLMTLPIVYCLGVVICLMLMVRIRYFIASLRKKKSP
ncbi:MAG TPA: YlaH-like family protein [Bacilli bacterium]